MKTTISGVITYTDRPEWDTSPAFQIFPFEMESSGLITVMPFSFEVEIPDNFDPRGKQVALLKAQKVKLSADFSARVTQIEREISKLTAIGNEVSA